MWDTLIRLRFEVFSTGGVHAPGFHEKWGSKEIYMKSSRLLCYYQWIPVCLIRRILNDSKKWINCLIQKMCQNLSTNKIKYQAPANPLSFFFNSQQQIDIRIIPEIQMVYIKYFWILRVFIRKTLYKNSLSTIYCTI
jgi:hypothetical protein